MTQKGEPLRAAHRRSSSYRGASLHRVLTTVSKRRRHLANLWERFHAVVSSRHMVPAWRARFHAHDAVESGATRRDFCAPPGYRSPSSVSNLWRPAGRVSSTCGGWILGARRLDLGRDFWEVGGAWPKISLGVRRGSLEKIGGKEESSVPRFRDR